MIGQAGNPPLGDTAPETDGVSRHVYPGSAMVGDYLRAAAGLVPSGLLLATAPVGPVAATVLGSFAAIFAVFGLRTALRHVTRIEVNETGVSAHALRSASISWSELDRLRLAYYSTSRDRKRGWMQLELGAGATRLRFDSRIEGFEDVARRAALAAAAHSIALNEATVANLRALAIRMPETGGGA